LDFVVFLGCRGKQDLREATREDLVRYLEHLARRGLHPNTVTNRFYRLRRFFGFLHLEGNLLFDPTVGFKRKPVAGYRRPWLSEAEVLSLLAAPDPTTKLGLRDRAMMEVFYSTGVRVSELLALELDDVELRQGFLTVRNGKGGRSRRVPLGRIACAWLGRYLHEVRPGLAVLPALTVFLSYRGRPLSKEDIDLKLRRYALAAKLEKPVSAHVLRHSFAVHLLRHGASTRHIQEMLGHRQLDTTQIYTRLLPSDLKEAHRRSHPRERRRSRGKDSAHSVSGEGVGKGRL
jgi:integrase/recombinase XerD